MQIDFYLENLKIAQNRSFPRAKIFISGKNL